ARCVRGAAEELDAGRCDQPRGAAGDRGRVLHHPRPRIPAADPRCRPGGPGGGPGQRVAHPHRPAHRGRAAGHVFPALFSGGVILVSVNFANVHLDTHAVLVGDLNLAAIGQLTVGGLAIGPPYLYVMATVLLVNIVAVTLLYPTLKVTTFDPRFAMALGIRTGAVNAAFM